jgi:predicted glycosyltransferase
MRFLFYSHDGLGLGHTRRHLTVASALAKAAPGSTILLATGAEEVVRYGLPAEVEILKLPGLRKDGNELYSSRRLRVSDKEIHELRSSLLLTAVKSFQPEVVLVDKHPFGAGGEFKAGLKALRKQGGRAVLGLRDILDEPRQVQKEWGPSRMQHRITRYYDSVFIYGDQAVFDPVNAYAFAPSLLERTRFCGYVLNREHHKALENFEWPFAERPQRSRPVVLATTGGGEDGFRVLEGFIRASAKAPWQGVAVAGPMMPEEHLATLEKLATEHSVTFRRFVPHLSALFGSLDALVCMGGYNTLIEAVALGVPTVCVPRVTPRIEQLMRAEAFERLGLVQVCRLRDLDPHHLSSKIRRALLCAPEELSRRARTCLRMNGARKAAQYLITLAAKVAQKRAARGRRLVEAERA